MAKSKTIKPWLNSRVPAGFWEADANRRAYMKWLGKELGYKKTEDWYDISKQDFHCRSGGGMLANYYRDSPQDAVFDHFPDYPWKCWLFRSTPQGFWKEKKNRKAYMDWLAEKLELRTLDDWYQISRSHFHTNYGGGLLANYFGDSIYRALEEYAPRKKWQPWAFHTVPQGYWKELDNRRAYMRWLGKEIGFKKQSDWYQLNRKHFLEHHGDSLFAAYYNGSVYNALVDYRPNFKWSKEKLRKTKS